MSYLFTDWDEAQAQQQIAKTSKQKIKLRPYQLTAVDAVYEEWLARMVRSTMVNIPTGGGKSVVFSEVMRRWDVSAMGKILLIAHRKELILQAIGHAMRAGLSSGMEMAGQHATGHEDVIVASVQTLNASRKCGVCFGEGCDECYNGKVKRFTRFNPRDFGLVVVDECVVGSTRIALANGSEATAETLFRNNKSVYVLSMNHDTGLIEPKPITARKVSTTQRIIVIRLKDGSTIECTPNHPVYCKRGYTPAETLTPKDVVLSKRDDLHSVRRHVHDRGFQKATLRELGVQKSSPEVVLCQVLSVTTEERTETVYDFTVDGNHNYFANGVLVHNCHHATSTSYRSVMKWFEQNPLQKTLMVTATPRRADKVGLHNVCQSIAYTMELREAIDEGWLVPIRQKFVTVEGLDISKVEVRAGKLNEGQVEAAFLGTDEDEERMLHSIVKPTIDEAAGRKTLVFAAGKDHAHKLSSCFAAHGVEAGVVVEDTDSAERAELIARYSNGDLQVLVGCLVFSEGFDAPSTEIIANCRPTKSESLYLQILGRSTRPLPGVVDGPETAEERRAAIAASAKPAAIMLDFVGNSGDIKLISVADVLAGDKIDPIDLEEALRVAVKSGETVDIEELAEKAKQSRLEAEQRKEVERRQRLLTNTKADRADYSTVDVDLFGGPEFASNGDKHVEPITKGQQGFLYHQLGMTRKQTKNMSKKQASAIIARTYKQAGEDWKRLIKEADNVRSLEQVGKAIKDRKSSDYLLKDERVLDSLRAAYKAREKEIGGA